jgi:hypothetical protein
MKNLLREVKREQKMAEHLFYVSLKYTKSGDVILNLIDKWQKMIGNCVELLLKKAKKNKKIIKVPIAPRAKEIVTREAYHKDPIVEKVLAIYPLFRRMADLEKIKEHEFRKNVAVRVIDSGKEIEINMEKLKEWYELFNNFVVFCEKIYASK